jgi:hypothetical protein
MDRESLKQTSKQELRSAFNDMLDATTRLWWRFFDWVAVVSWKRLFAVWLLVMVLCGLLNMPEVGLWFGCVAAIVKIVGGGKRRADLEAQKATERAQMEALERNVAEARIAAMQAQIEPHFLFNTLAAVEQLIETDPPRAAKMQRTLIRYLRAALPKMREGATGTTLGEQIALSRAFLEIMQVRMDERLRFEIDLPNGLASAEFPSMMLQTLVENAIQHGLEPKAEGGLVKIGAEVADGELRVRVQDDGVGFGQAQTHGSGVGLQNIRERLRMLYAGAAELIVEVPPQGGTLVRIHLPYRVNRPVAATA